jgi:XTP/dITP diphosphohydrolase
MREIVFATKNKGKIKEIQAVLGSSFDVKSMEEAGIEVDIDECGQTFEENAVIKAETVMKECGKLVLADDSGLEIDYLDKKPGVLSARFMGENTSYDIKNKKLLEMLEGVPDEKRTARFVCAIACASPNSETYVLRETIEGIIGYDMSGENGFGYDPIFYVPELKKTTAQLTMEEKNNISHRGKALARIKSYLESK